MSTDTDAPIDRQPGPSTGGDSATVGPPTKKKGPPPARTPPHPPLPGRTDMTPQGPLDPEATEFYLNRELTWLNFAWRVVTRRSTSARRWWSG